MSLIGVQLYMESLTFAKSRRQFLNYLVAGTTGTLILGWIFPQRGVSREVNLETLCSLFPYNSRCKDYLPGVVAVDDDGNPIKPSSLFAKAKPGIPLPVEGLPQTTYLVIQDGPKIAEYGIRPVCTHLGCTVAWVSEQDRFICPCHGSQYDAMGRVIHGPAKRALPLVTVIVKQNQIRLVESSPGIDPR